MSCLTYFLGPVLYWCWRWVDPNEYQDDELQSLTVDPDCEYCEYCETVISEIWDTLHDDCTHTTDEILEKLQTIFEQPDFEQDMAGGSHETRRKLMDVLLILALTAPSEGNEEADDDDDRQQIVFYQLDRNFQRLFQHNLTDVLNRKVILKTETGKSFTIYSTKEFCEIAQSYLNVINRLDTEWKKRVYLVQFLNFLANNRELHLWPSRSRGLCQAVAEKMDEWEEIEQKPLIWHRKILFPDQQK